jgi:hypothetical protein
MADYTKNAKRPVRPTKSELRRMLNVAQDRLCSDSHKASISQLDDDSAVCGELRKALAWSESTHVAHRVSKKNVERLGKLDLVNLTIQHHPEISGVLVKNPDGWLLYLETNDEELSFRSSRSETFATLPGIMGALGALENLR